MSVRNLLAALPLRRLARVTALLAVALAAGHLIQTLASRKTHIAVNTASSEPTSIVQLSAGADEEAFTAFAQPAVAPDYLSAASTLERTRSFVPDQIVCAEHLTLQPEAGGMIAVSLIANCHPGERIVLRHAGLAVTGKINPDGAYQAALPALAAAESVDILFQDGSRLSQTVAMPEVAALRRFGVQWQGAEAFAVQGFENGADIGQPDVISATNRGTSRTGNLVLLGDASVENPLLAQVYTYPANPLRPVDVVVEAAVTAETCGHDLLGDVIISAAGLVEITDLTLAMPDCSGVGDFLVLKNLATDMKIAAN
jgi:hypothetical protein